MEKVFVSVQDSAKQSSVYVNLNHVVSVAQNGSAAIIINLSTGHNIPSNTTIEQFANLIQDFVYKK